MNPNSPDASRSLAKLRNFRPSWRAGQLIEMAQEADDFDELRQIFADRNNLKVDQVPELP